MTGQSHRVLRLLAMLCMFIVVTPAAYANCTRGLVGEGKSGRLWVDDQGSGPVTVLFESGNGNDSTVWDAITPRVRKFGVRTFAYDRAGLGRSDPAPKVYKVDAELARLQRLLRLCRVTGPIVFVAHSYGGLLGLMTAENDKRIKAMVMVDAVVPGAMSAREIAVSVAKLRPDYATFRKEDPKRAGALIPLMEAMESTRQRFERTAVSPTMQFIDIVADRATFKDSDPRSNAEWLTAHAEFVASNPNREAVFARGSGHKVMLEKPDLVVDAIGRMLSKLGYPSPR
jgi:pimeloyl-ACP methyl ester carboxylesterase